MDEHLMLPTERVDSDAAWEILETILRNNQLFHVVIPLCRQIIKEFTSFDQITSSACRGLEERFIPEGIWIKKPRDKQLSELSVADQELWCFQVKVLSELKCIVIICFLSIASLDASLDAKILREHLSDSLQKAYSRKALVKGKYLEDTATNPFEGLCENETMLLNNYRKYVILALTFLPPTKNKALIMSIAAHFEGREQCARYCAGGDQTVHTIRREIIFELEAKRMHPYYRKQSSKKKTNQLPKSTSEPKTQLELVLTEKQKSDIEDVIENFITSGPNTSWPRLDLIADCNGDETVFATMEHMRYLYGDIWHVPGVQGALISEANKVVQSYDRNRKSYDEHMSRLKNIDLTSLKTNVPKTMVAPIKAAVLSCRVYCFYLLYEEDDRFRGLDDAETYLQRFKVWIMLAINLNAKESAMQVSVTACGRLEGSIRSYSFGGGRDVYTDIRKKIYYHFFGGTYNIPEDAIEHVNNNGMGEIIFAGTKRVRSEVTEDDLESASPAKRSHSSPITSEQSEDIDEHLQLMENDPVFSPQPRKGTFLADDMYSISDEEQPNHWIQGAGGSLVAMSPSNLTDNDEEDKSVHSFWDDNKENNNDNENALNFGSFYAQQNMMRASVFSGMERGPFHIDAYEVIEDSRCQYSSGSSNGYSRGSLVAMSPSNLTDNDEEDKSVHSFWDDDKENNNDNQHPLNFGSFYAQQNMMRASVILNMERDPFHAYEVSEYWHHQYSSGSSNGYSRGSLVTMSQSNLTDNDEEDKSVQSFFDNKENNNDNENALDFDFSCEENNFW